VNERVVLINPPPDCDFGGVWEVLDEIQHKDGNNQLRLRQGNSYIGALRANVRAATPDDVMVERAATPPTRLPDTRSARIALAERAVRLALGLTDIVSVIEPQDEGVRFGLDLVAVHVGAVRSRISDAVFAAGFPALTSHAPSEPVDGRCRLVVVVHLGADL
jgi:hypothetical protein